MKKTDTLKILISIAVVCFLFLPPIYSKDLDDRDVYLTEYKNRYLNTTDRNIKIYTMRDPDKQGEDSRLYFRLILPKKWTEKWTLKSALHIYVHTISDGGKVFVGCFALRNFEDLDGVPDGDYARFPFSIAKKNLAVTTLVFETQNERITIHLREKQ